MERTAVGVLLIGKMGSGKGVVSDQLCSEFGFNRHSMATWLKNTIKTHYKLKELNKNDVITLCNGVELTVRRVLQLFGTEHIRRFDPDWHVDEVINSINDVLVYGYPLPNPYKFVIDDIRFKNEIECLTKKYKCVTIRIVADELKRIERICLRDSLTPDTDQMSHASETELDTIDTDYVITNNGSLNDLNLKVKGIIETCELMKL